MEETIQDEFYQAMVALISDLGYEIPRLEEIEGDEERHVLIFILLTLDFWIHKTIRSLRPHHPQQRRPKKEVDRSLLLHTLE